VEPKPAQPLQPVARRQQLGELGGLPEPEDDLVEWDGQVEDGLGIERGHGGVELGAEPAALLFQRGDPALVLRADVTAL